MSSTTSATRTSMSARTPAAGRGVRTVRTGAAVLTVGVIAVATAPGAAAHVGVSATTTEAGQYTVLTVSVPHGCEESPTHTVAVQMPESIPVVTPSVNDGWEVEKVMVALDEPLDDGHGGQLTERVEQVVYTTTTPLPADLRDAFELSVKLPDLPGETILFPTVQTCDEGETAWVQETGADGEEPEHPAPAITLSAPAEQGAAEAAGAVLEDAALTSSETTAAAEAPGTGQAVPTALLAVSVVAGLAGAVMGGLALARTRRQA